MTLLGILLGSGALVYVIEQWRIASFFFDLNSAVLVFGGTLACTLLTYPWKFISVIPSAVRLVIFSHRTTPQQAILRVTALAGSAKVSGIRQLQDDLPALPIPFLRDALGMLIDDMGAVTIKEKLEKELVLVRARHQQVASVFRAMGGYATNLGILGGAIGVIQLLSGPSSQESGAAAAAIAVTSLLYGIISTNFIFLPIAGKLTIYSDEDLIIRELIVQGILAIQKGEVPSVIERRLEAFLAYRMRKSR